MSNPTYSRPGGLGVCVGVCAALLAACKTSDRRLAPVTPQRPTFSADTFTTAPGTVELEAGLTLDPGDLYDTPTTVKYGYDARTDLFLGLSPIVDVDTNGRDDTGLGDILIGVRHRVWEDRELGASAAVQLATKLPTADDETGLGSGEVDFFLRAIYAWTIDELTVVGNYELGVIGDPTGDTDVSHAFAGALAHPISEKVGIFGELAALYHPDGPDNALGMLGATYAFAESLVFDSGLVIGLGKDAPDFQLLFGVTTNFGIL